MQPDGKNIMGSPSYYMSGAVAFANANIFLVKAFNLNDALWHRKLHLGLIQRTHALAL